MAEVRILFEGYVGDEGEEMPVASTVGFIRAGDRLIVIDPGMVPSSASILRPLRDAGAAPSDVTDVVLSHHHPDHTLNAALFPDARVHDHWAIYKGDRWIDRGAEGAEVAPGMTLLETPGHTRQDITTVVDTESGITAFTHLWWFPDGPEEDEVAEDPEALHASRARILGIANVIVPGHGAPFEPGPRTPR